MPTPRSLRLVVAGVAAALTLALAVPAGAASSDKTIAKTGVIVTKDLPSSWGSTAADSGSDQELESIAGDFTECDDYLASRKLMDKASAHQVSRQFSDPSGGSVNDETWVFKDTAKAKQAFKAMGASANADCLTSVFQKVFTTQLAADPTTAGKISGVNTQIQAVSSSALPNDGDDQLGYAGQVQVTYADGSAEYLFLAYFGIRTDRGILGYTVSASTDASGNLADSFTGPAEKAIHETAGRMEKALNKG